MDEKLKKWLYDVLKSIEEIEDYASQANRNFIRFKENKMMKRAIERNLEILGEAVNRILQVDESIEITDARKIVGLRNNIIHSYETVSDEIIWSIVIKHIPKLKKEITKLIQE